MRSRKDGSISLILYLDTGLEQNVEKGIRFSGKRNTWSNNLVKLFHRKHV